MQINPTRTGYWPLHLSTVNSKASTVNANLVSQSNSLSKTVASSQNTSPTEEVNAPEGLKKILSQYDLTNITPNQLGQLGGTLFEQGYISQTTAAVFVSTEGDTIGRDPNKPINAIDHFQFMLGLVNDMAKNSVNDMTMSKQYYSDSLNTVINLNAISKNNQSNQPFHTTA